MKILLHNLLLIALLCVSCGQNTRQELIGNYHRTQDDSEINLNLYEDSTFVHSSTRDVSKYEISDYSGKATLQLNGKWGVSNDSLQLITLHMSDFGKGMEMNDTMYYKIIQFKDDILVIKSLSNNDIYEYRRENN
ncbi:MULTISPECIES: hypothetical protein [Bacteroidales]|jgi:hypothetical protein|uniref:Lipocalin-like domain-containing protein n=1 Tax=Muribaculum gordoncarteri TaxID=2530390 RepID=A0A4P7VCR9_9BACT|nr:MULTISPECIES: hypothetical protein [Bacteroidales]QCD34444.1 hypothetical protein E7746_00380 [Muribaculum gordoncarteri]